MAVIRDHKGMASFVPDAPPPVVPVDLGDMPSSNDNGTVDVTADGTHVITMPDGSVVIEVGKGDGADGDLSDTAFNDNIADKMDSSLSAIAMDLMDGIDADIRSRSALVAAYNKGMDMLGLKIEDRSGRRTRKNTSTIRHPVMLEAIIDFQSSFRGEMLPADGPCKVSVEGGNADAGDDDLAQQLEADFNFYLTNTATEYYPDSDRGAFYLAYGGTLFKKIYYCPMRKRPVSECVYLTDLIVSENATDLMNALRVTHKIEMSRGDVRRMQLAGVWRDIALMTPSNQQDSTKMKEKMQMGINRSGLKPRDIPYTIYECYCELVPEDYNFKEKGVPDDMPLPYRVTIEKESRQVLAVHRLWKEGDELYRKQLPFVMYGLVPGMGFLALGYLHLLGNQTMALTALWRIMVDAGMFANFPGGVKVKGTRQTTNEINPGPGEFQEIDTGPMDDIRKALMPMPYKDPSPVLLQLAEAIALEAGRVGSVVKLEIGDGKEATPVGTIMAQIEQQTKTMAAVHKRMHNAQKEEFTKLKVLFEEYPEALWISNPKARKWKGEELKNKNLVPVSDPNVPTQMHRIMQATALIMLSSQNPDIYDKIKVHERALKTMGIDYAQSVMKPPQQLNAPQPPDPKTQAMMMQNQIKQGELSIKQQQQQREAADRVAQVQEKNQQMTFEQQQTDKELASRERIAMIEQETARIKANSDQNITHTKLISDHVGDALDRAHQAGMAQLEQQHKTGIAALDRSHDANMAAADMQHEHMQNRLGEDAAMQQAIATKPEPATDGE